MADADVSRGTFPDSVNKALIGNSSRIYSILIVLILITLVALAGYLLSDILSFRLTAAQEGSFSGFDIQGNKSNTTGLEGWQEKGVNLVKHDSYSDVKDASAGADKKLGISPGPIGPSNSSNATVLSNQRTYNQARLNQSKIIQVKPANIDTSGGRRSNNVPINPVKQIDWASINKNEHSSLDSDPQLISGQSHTSEANQYPSSIKPHAAYDRNSNNNISKSLPVAAAGDNLSENRSLVISKNASGSFNVVSSNKSATNQSVYSVVPAKNEVNHTVSNSTAVKDNLTFAGNTSPANNISVANNTSLANNTLLAGSILAGLSPSAAEHLNKTTSDKQNTKGKGSKIVSASRAKTKVQSKQGQINKGKKITRSTKKPAASKLTAAKPKSKSTRK